MVVYDSLVGAPPPDRPSCVALGLFDGLHPGHRSVIGAAVEDARRENHTPCVFTFSIGHDHPAAKPESGRLLTGSLRDRLLEEMGVAYMLCPPFGEFMGMTPEAFARDVLHGLLRAKRVFCGENYHFGKDASGTPADLRALGAAYGFEVRTLPMVVIDGAPVSSSRIRDCVARGDMPAVRRLLGRPFAIDFEVIPGRKLGRTIDSPTINQALPDWLAKPRFGVYASVATVEGRRYTAVTNVGVKPTVGSDRALSETCILGYDGDLYGQAVPVELWEFLRPEQKFASLDALRAQIARDSEAATAIVHSVNGR